ncbi:hypothetical protein BCR34DRAFT_582530 [Clohesyomyces aquaticus]|uniref:Uncharacterized protein n=1 Tax=Clohesyomyces aquaticus TaxID=1231657 RepID=A0A1Y2A8X3_9PLEO|nr:hypothetical protein BCR34DRAFT_582530 [Clohesyomyces aquaticus]
MSSSSKFGTFFSLVITGVIVYFQVKTASKEMRNEQQGHLGVDSDRYQDEHPPDMSEETRHGVDQKIWTMTTTRCSSITETGSERVETEKYLHGDFSEFFSQIRDGRATLHGNQESGELADQKIWTPTTTPPSSSGDPETDSGDEECDITDADKFPEDFGDNL